MQLNGWVKHGGTALLGLALGYGATLLQQGATQKRDIETLLEFKARIDRNVEEWRGDQQGAKDLREITMETRRNTRALLRWADRVSAQLHVPPPDLPNDGGSGGASASVSRLADP